MPDSSVGSKNQPGRSTRFPPASTVAPLPTASWTYLSTSSRPDSVASGPTWVSSSIGSPTVSAPIFSANSRVNSSATSRCTKNRLAAMQLCPLFWLRAVTATSAALSRSAEGMTMNGSLPPSSSTVFFSASPAMAATDCPARSEEHTSELQSRQYLVCRLLLEKKSSCTPEQPWFLGVRY